MAGRNLKEKLKGFLATVIIVRGDFVANTSRLVKSFLVMALSLGSILGFFVLCVRVPKVAAVICASVFCAIVIIAVGASHVSSSRYVRKMNAHDKL